METRRFFIIALCTLSVGACAQETDIPNTPDRGVSWPDSAWPTDQTHQVDLGGSSEAGSRDRGGGDTGPGPDPGSFVAVTAGTFKMGSPSDEPCRESDETQHEVVLTHNFEIGKEEVSQGEFEAALTYNPSSHSACGASCPVDNVNWHEAVAYCNALSASKGLTECYSCTGSQQDVVCEVASAFTGGQTLYDCPGYRLPTEAEWEFAYRAGTDTAYYIGENDPAQCTGTDTRADTIGWYNKNSSSETHEGGLKQANDWGLYDMAGNVHEWVNDFRESDLGTAKVTDPLGAATSQYGVLRGGSYAHGAETLRAAYRQQQTLKGRGAAVGFRCARSTS